MGFPSSVCVCMLFRWLSFTFIRAFVSWMNDEGKSNVFPLFNHKRVSRSVVINYFIRHLCAFIMICLRCLRARVCVCMCSLPLVALYWLLVFSSAKLHLLRVLNLIKSIQIPLLDTHEAKALTDASNSFLCLLNRIIRIAFALFLYVYLTLVCLFLYDKWN